MTISSPVTSRTETTPPSTIDARDETAPPRPAIRVFARAVDMVTTLFLTLALVIVGLAPLMDALSDRFDPEPWGRALSATILYALVASTYEIAFLAVRGQTPGKDVCKLRVVDAATGSTPSWAAAGLRTLPFFVLRLVPGALLGSLACLVLGAAVPFDGRRRGVHDLLARTEVVRYDADVEEDDPPQLDRSDLAGRYGPRSLLDLIRGRTRR